MSETLSQIRKQIIQRHIEAAVDKHISGREAEHPGPAVGLAVYQLQGELVSFLMRLLHDSILMSKISIYLADQDKKESVPEHVISKAVASTRDCVHEWLKSLKKYAQRIPQEPTSDDIEDAIKLVSDIISCKISYSEKEAPHDWEDV